MYDNTLQTLLSQCPGPFHYIPSTNGVNRTFEVRCQSTDRRLIATEYWDERAAAELTADSVTFALNVINDGKLFAREFNELPQSLQFLLARYPGPFYSEFGDHEYDPMHTVVCQATQQIIIGASGCVDSREERDVATAVADALNILLSTVTSIP